MRDGDTGRIAIAARWFFARSALFLRSERGGRRGRERVTARFDAFRNERYEWLVADWRRSVASSRVRVREGTSASNESAAEQAVRLIRDLEPARAVDRLLRSVLATSTCRKA